MAVKMFCLGELCKLHPQAEINQPLAAPNPPASVLRNMPEELWEWQESVSMFWSRFCMGTALSKALPVRSDCDPRTERLCQQDRQLRMWGCSALLPQQGQDAELRFPLTTILHLWHFGKRKIVSWKIKPWNMEWETSELVTTFRRIINAQPCEAALSYTFIWGFFTSIMENYALDSSQSCRGIQGT